MSLEEIDEFCFEIIAANDVVIISLIGVLNERFNNEFEKCLNEIAAFNSRLYVINFGKISKIYNSGHRFICQMQQNIRSKEQKVLHYGTNDKIWSHLYDTGILKRKEMASTLMNCLLKAKKMSTVQK